MKIRIGIVALLLVALSTMMVFGQQDGMAGYSADRPTALATSVAEPLEIDGLVIGDEFWSGISSVGDLIQTQPIAGAPASEKTDIRIAYSKTHLYVGIICYDQSPDRLVVSDARRDAALDNTDAFLFILDTYHDGQNGFMFGTNPLGVEFDAQVDKEGQGNFNSNRQQGGTIGGFNVNWDASWDVESRVIDEGWSAEFAIPLRTLRYKSGSNVTWGINFRRNIRKTNEIAYWAALPIQFDLKRLSLAGDLGGLTLQSPKNLKFIPYGLLSASRDRLADDQTVQVRPEVGADIKYSLSTNMTLDLTYNTDFAQVEVDDQQVNLDRFNLFFPEKRPFFLENAGQFSVGSPGEVDLFFSRRIGIDGSGQQVPILGGARMSGKINKTNIGLLSMFTESINESNINQNNFSVARVNHEMGRSALGAAFINRQGIKSEGDDYNRVFALDGRLGLGKKAQLSGFLAKSNTPGIESNDHSFKLLSSYEWNGLQLSGGYTEVGEGFNPEVGFLLRNSFRKPEFRILKQLRFKNKLGLLEIRPHISYRSYWNFDNELVTSFLHVDNHWEFVSGMEIHTGINFTVEGVLADFEIAPGVIVPAGSYHHQEAQLVFWTNPSKPFSVNIRSILGGFFGGTRYNNSITFGFIGGDKFNASLVLRRNDVHLPGGRFDTNIFQARMAYSFTPRIYLQSLVQYNSLVDLWSANIRFGWLQQANTGLFLVVNTNKSPNFIDNQSFIAKYTHMIDVIK